MLIRISWLEVANHSQAFGNLTDLVQFEKCLCSSLRPYKLPECNSRGKTVKIHWSFMFDYSKLISSCIKNTN